MWFDILALLSLIAVMALLRQLVNIFPSLMACLIRWKENVNLQTSLKMRTSRDMIAGAMFIPFCLVVFRFRMYCPGFIDGMADGSRLWATIGMIAAYVMLRFACKLTARTRSTTASIYKNATDSARTYFIILTIMLVTTGGILMFFDTPVSHIRTAMFWISGAIYTLFLLRKTQIFLSSCNIFVSFLYLCALEILPTGVLIASAVIF